MATGRYVVYGMCLCCVARADGVEDENGVFLAISVWICGMWNVGVGLEGVLVACRVDMWHVDKVEAM